MALARDGQENRGMSSTPVALPRTILVPTDFSAGGTAAVDYATALAAKLDARVHLLHVVTLPTYGLDLTGMATATMIDELSRGGEEALAKLIADRTTTSFGPPLLRIGDARDVIDNAAREIKADLIVMGTHGRRGFSRLLLPDPLAVTWFSHLVLVITHSLPRDHFRRQNVVSRKLGVRPAVVSGSKGEMSR